MEACEEDIRVFIVVPLFNPLYVHAKSAVFSENAILVRSTQIAYSSPFTCIVWRGSTLLSNIILLFNTQTKVPTYLILHETNAVTLWQIGLRKQFNRILIK